MPSKWANIARNARHPSRLVVMANKVLKRAESDTRDEATAWAKERATSIDSYCSRLDSDLWSASKRHCLGLEVDARSRLQEVGIDLGGGGAYPLLHFLVRLRQPTLVVETGVAAGWSSRAILEALDANGNGSLYSSDFPYFRLENPERYVGLVVPTEVRKRWHLDIRGDRRALPDIVGLVDRIDLFHYDSDKSSSGRRFAIDTVVSKLSPDAAILMDDIQDNVFFRDWVGSSGLTPVVFEFGGKYIGAIGLDP
jgi:predicted O-methyltransferase YrrM